MGKKSGSNDKKKKGPKGKIARAKAKLDRQWGEEANDENAKKRVGRSRILSRRPPPARKEGQQQQQQQQPATKSNSKKVREEPVVDWNYNSDDDSHSSVSEHNDDDDDDNNEIVGGGAFYSKLLKNIRKTNKKSHDDFDHSEEDSMQDDLEDDDDDDDATNAPLGMQLVDAEDVKDKGDNNDIGTTHDDENFDPFGKRFSNMDPLSEDEEQQAVFLRKLQQTEKVGVPHVDPMLELQVSKSLLDDIMGVANTGRNDVPKQSWTKLASQAFACNRDVLKRQWEEARSKRSTLSSLQSVLYPFVTRYADCLITCNSKANREQASKLVLLHIVNHVLTSRGRIQRHNRKLKAMAEEDEAMAENDADNDEKRDEEVFKDQGYTRPTVLVLLPTRGICHKFVKQLIHMVDGNAPEEYVERLDKEYGAPPQEDDEEGDDDAMRRRRKKVLDEKGAAWQELFGDDANDDDDFKIGIALNAKSANSTGKGGKKENSTTASSSSGVNVKLYTDFYGSDIIVASPLGLKMALSADSNEGESDFLSSIEICLLDRSDVLMMQNWDHVNDVLESLNKLPKNNNETDFSRVRNYFLVDQAANWRQTIVFSDILDPAILSTFKRFAKSQSGVLKTRQKVLEDEGSIANVLVPLRQVFQQIPTKTFSTISDDRMQYMTQTILPSIIQKRQKHTMIYIPSYFDFVLLRNYLIKNEADFVSINEYSRVSETSRGRARFLQGRKPLMLYTGRAHYFLRHKIKGIRNLIFFGLPEHSEFYPDLVNALNEGLENVDADSSNGASTSSIALFTKYEAHALERIVGTKQSNRMVKGDKSTFMFLS